MAATGNEKLYVSQNGGFKSTITAQEVADLAGGGGVAAFVGDADPTDAASVAAGVDAIRDALVAAGLMAAA